MCVVLGFFFWGYFICVFGMIYFGCDEVNFVYYVVGKVFFLMIRKYGFVILKKQSIFLFYINNVIRIWSQVKFFYEQNLVKSVRNVLDLYGSFGCLILIKEMIYLFFKGGN